MQSLFIEYVFLIIIILALVMVANKVRVAYPIILVIGGLVLSFTSAFSNLAIDPELVFFIFLPPLLYEAAWQTSWKEFWKWRRVIMSFAFLIVIITSVAIAFVSSWLIPGFTLALGLWHHITPGCCFSHYYYATGESAKIYGEYCRRRKFAK